MNGPGQSQSGIDVPIAIGVNTFTTFANHRFADVGYYGLSLVFNGFNVPVIFGYVAAQTSSTSTPPLAAIPSTSLIRWDDSVVPSSGNLSSQIGDEMVTLTSFRYGTIGGYNADRVAEYGAGANGVLDNIGQFALTVSVVPETTLYLLLATGMGPVVLALLGRLGPLRWGIRVGPKRIGHGEGLGRLTHQARVPERNKVPADEVTPSVGPDPTSFSRG